VLVNFNHKFCIIRPPFAPPDMRMASERLQFDRTRDEVHVAVDGTFIGPRHLWSVLVGMAAKWKGPMAAQEASRALFIIPTDVHAAVLDLMAKADLSSSYWKAMSKHGWYDSTNGIIHHIRD